MDRFPPELLSKAISFILTRQMQQFRRLPTSTPLRASCFRIRSLAFRCSQVLILCKSRPLLPMSASLRLVTWKWLPICGPPPAYYPFGLDKPRTRRGRHRIHGRRIQHYASWQGVWCGNRPGPDIRLRSRAHFPGHGFCRHLGHNGVRPNEIQSCPLVSCSFLEVPSASAACSAPPIRLLCGCATFENFSASCGKNPWPTI